MIGLSFMKNYQTAINSLFALSDSTLTAKFAQSFTMSEYERCKWLVNTLVNQKMRFSNVAIVGSSFSTYLVPMLCTQLKQVDNIVLYDRDPQKIDMARALHRNLRPDTSIDFCLLDVQESADKISGSSYDLVVVPYADRMPEMVNIRTQINKATYVLQAEVGDVVRDEKDLIISSGCTQQSFRSVERFGGKQVAMVIGSKRI